MRERKWLTLFGAIAVIAATTGAARKESGFDASPKERALIVVDARVQRKTLLATQESPIVSGTLRVRTPGVRKAPDLSALAASEVLVFAVEPGRYRPGSVTARAPKMQVGTGTVDLQIPLPTDSLRGLEQTLSAGAVAYVGRIDIMTVTKAFRPNEYRFTLAYDPGRERQVWERLLAKGMTGAWEEVIQSRLDAITAAGDSAAAGDSLSADDSASATAPADSVR